MRIKQDDQVKIISGDEKGKTGRVLQVYRDRGTILIEGANMIWEHVRRSQKHPKGGRIQREAELNASKVMIVCQSCDKPTRIKIGKGEAKEKEKSRPVRLCAKCGKPVRAEE